MKPMNQKETIQFLKDRINLSKGNELSYKQHYELCMKDYDIELAQKYYDWMKNEHSVWVELNYVLNTITGKGY